MSPEISITEIQKYLLQTNRRRIKINYRILIFRNEEIQITGVQTNKLHIYQNVNYMNTYFKLHEYISTDYRNTEIQIKEVQN